LACAPVNIPAQPSQHKGKQTLAIRADVQSRAGDLFEWINAGKLKVNIG
jgi:hypothetical protein